MGRRRPRPSAPAMVAGVLAMVLVAPGVPAAADRVTASPAWNLAGIVQERVFAAQAELIVGGPGRAAVLAGQGRTAYRGALAAGIRQADPSADRAVRAALARSAQAAGAGDPVALAAARGALRAALLRGSYAATRAAIARGDAGSAREWLLLREYRTATRFTRPGSEGVVALARLARGTARPAAVRAAVSRDLLDAYGARLRELLDDAGRAHRRGLPVSRALAAAQANGYFAIVAPRYREDRGHAAEQAARADFAALASRAARGGAGFAAAQARAAAALDGFNAAPFTTVEAARRAQQLLRFAALVPIEYGRGVSGGRVTKDFEIQEAIAFAAASRAAFADLEDQLVKRNPSASAVAERSLGRLEQLSRLAAEGANVASPAVLEATGLRAERSLSTAMPAAWRKPSEESDYDLIELTLDRMEAAAGAGQYRQAEQARLEAYAFFEFGPERRLRVFDPGLALEVEGLVWFGTQDTPGLAKLIAQRAPRREVHQTRLVLDRQLAAAAATLGDSASRTTVVTNSAIIVFREGLEAVLILAAITASFVGVRRRLRRPVMVGAVLGLVASLVTWVAAQTLLRSLERYGERLEAIVGLVAIAVLLVITNWFFHRVYWSEWIGRFHRRRRALEQRSTRASFLSAQALGLALLGLTSVYREGFETVLFLQSLQLSAGTVAVMEGASLGLVLTLAVAAATFALQRKLPYKRMLIVTGVLIGFVLVVMVGQTVRTMQGTGWVSISSLDLELPYWLGLWLGVYPTWETIGAQVLAIAFVVGSYFLAQEVRVKRPRRRARTAMTPAVARQMSTKA